MAVYFTFGTGDTIEKHAGKDPFLIACEEVVVSVQADGHELELIKLACHNLPYHQGRVVSWYGDHAQFIAHNWNRINKS